MKDKSGWGKVSIVMPAFNRGYIIFNAIHSVLRQTYTDWELIIVDDGSTDDTTSRVAEFKDDRIVFIHYDMNLGANHARNVGLQKSRGVYIAFIDTDNEWHPDYLEKQIGKLESNENKPDVVFARSLIKDKEGLCKIFPLETKDQLSTDDKIIERSMFASVFDTNVVCMRREIWETAGGFDEKLKRHQDWEYFLRLLVEKKYTFQFNDEILNTNYHQKDSISNKDSLFWDARLYIFEKYIYICRKIGRVSDVILWSLDNEHASHIAPEQAERLFSLLTPEEKMQFCKQHYSQHAHRMCLTNVKNNKIMETQEKWMRSILSGRRVGDILQEKNVRSVCIYGLGFLGRSLREELSGSEIEIKYIIDNNASPEDVSAIREKDMKTFDVDAIIVTPVSEYEQIKQSLRERTSVPIYNIVELVDEL